MLLRPLKIKCSEVFLWAPAGKIKLLPPLYDTKSEKCKACIIGDMGPRVLCMGVGHSLPGWPCIHVITLWPSGGMSAFSGILCAACGANLVARLNCVLAASTGVTSPPTGSPGAFHNVEGNMEGKRCLLVGSWKLNSRTRSIITG